MTTISVKAGMGMKPCLLACALVLAAAAGAAALPGGYDDSMDVPQYTNTSNPTFSRPSAARDECNCNCNCTQELGASQATGRTSKDTAATMAAIQSSELVSGRYITVGDYTRFLLALKNDEHVGASLLRGIMFEESTLKEMMKHIRKGSTVVEAGANMGAYTVFYAAKAGPAGKVVAFEPQNLVHQVLSSNLLLNGISRVQAINGAAYFKEGHVNMMGKVTDGVAAGKDYTSATVQQQQLNYGGMALGNDGERVTAVTIDSLRLANVSFMKFDVQGAESVAMYGARETIRRELPVITLEWDLVAIREFTREHMLTTDMPVEVQTFDALSFLKGLGYKLLQKVSAMDYFCFPPGYKHGELPQSYLFKKGMVAAMRARRRERKRRQLHE